MTIGAPAPDDIFTDNHRWGDLDEWNRTAMALHERGGIHRIEREGFRPFWAVIDHAAVLDIERQPKLFTNGSEPVLIDRRLSSSSTASSFVMSMISGLGHSQRPLQQPNL